jgi:PAS domain S-box-containing protein
MSDADTQQPEWLLQMGNILETLNEGVVIVDDGLGVVFVNGALLRLTGYLRGEVRGRTPEALFPAEDVPYLMQQHTRKA